MTFEECFEIFSHIADGGCFRGAPAPGESKQISFTLYAQDMSHIGTENKPVLEPGLFEVMAGGLTGQFRLV